MLQNIWISAFLILSALSGSMARQVDDNGHVVDVEMDATADDSRISSRSLKQATRDSILARAAVKDQRRIVERANPSPVAAPQTVTAYSTVTNSNQALTKFYSGGGFTENDNNPTNTNSGNCQPKQTTFAAATAQNTAIQNCVAYAVDQSCTDANGIRFFYSSVQIYYLDTATASASGPAWICRAYNQYTARSDSSYFNVANSKASPVFGYQQ